MDNEQGTIRDRIEGMIRVLVEGVKPLHESGRGRPRIIPTVALWGGLLVCVLRGMSSQLALHQLLNIQGLWNYPRFGLSDEAVYKRLSKAEPETFQRLFKDITEAMNQQWKQEELVTHQLAPFARGVYAVDGSALDKISKRLPHLREEPETVLAGKITGVFDIRKQLWHSVSYHEHYRQNDKVSAWEDIEGVPKGSLLLFDMGYFSFAWFDQLHEQGYYWISRMRENTSYEVIHTFYDHQGVTDQLVHLGVYRADRAKYPVRLIQITYKGHTSRYITNVDKPQVLTAFHIAQLYRRRWDIEMMFNMVKTQLRLHFLMSSKPNVFLHQVFAVFTIAQIMLGLRNEVAYLAKADVTEISIMLFIRWTVELARSGQDPVAVIAQYGRSGGIIRPTPRTQVNVPQIDPSIIHDPPPDLVRTRNLRYAGKSRPGEGKSRVIEAKTRTVKNKSRTVEGNGEPARKRGRPRKNPI